MLPILYYYPFPYDLREKGGKIHKTRPDRMDIHTLRQMGLYKFVEKDFPDKDTIVLYKDVVNPCFCADMVKSYVERGGWEYKGITTISAIINGHRKPNSVTKNEPQ